MRLLILAAFICLCGSCSTSEKRHARESSYDTLYKTQYAERFEILQARDSLFIRVRNPWQGATDVTIDYNITALGNHPRVLCMSSSHVAFLDVLGGAENIIGVSGRNFISNSKIRLNNIPDVGYDNNLNYEMIVALKPDVVFIYEVSGEQSVTTTKLRQLGIPVMYIADYLESTPLARAEWLMVFGTILGRADQAKSEFEAIEGRYLAVRDSIRRSTDSVVKPKVMLNSPYRDVWYVPGDRSYIVQLITDAGGEYLAAGVENDVSRPISSEVAYEMLSRADYWLNPGGSKTLTELRTDNHRFGKLDVVRQKRVYNNNARSTPEGGSDFWESGIVKADVVLSDLAKILHPGIIEKHRLYYFHQLK